MVEKKYYIYENLKFIEPHMLENKGKMNIGLQLAKMVIGIIFF